MTIIILQFTDKEELNEKETQMPLSPIGNSDAQPVNLNSAAIKDVVNQKEVICLGRKRETLRCYCVTFSKNKKQTTTFIGREIKSRLLERKESTFYVAHSSKTVLLSVIHARPFTLIFFYNSLLGSAKCLC